MWSWIPNNIIVLSTLCLLVFRVLQNDETKMWGKAFHEVQVVWIQLQPLPALYKYMFWHECKCFYIVCSLCWSDLTAIQYLILIIITPSPPSSLIPTSNVLSSEFAAARTGEGEVDRLSSEYCCRSAASLDCSGSHCTWQSHWYSSRDTTQLWIKRRHFWCICNQFKG